MLDPPVDSILKMKKKTLNYYKFLFKKQVFFSIEQIVYRFFWKKIQIDYFGLNICKIKWQVLLDSLHKSVKYSLWKRAINFIKQ